MRKRYHHIWLLMAVLGLALLPALPAQAITDEESDRIAKEAAAKALEKVGIKPKEGEPSFLARMQATALDMPAVKQTPVKWQAMSKNYAIQDMRFIAPNRMLVTQLFTFPRLIDTKTGEVVWQFFPEGRLVGFQSLVAAFSDLVLLRDDKNKEQQTALTAMDGKTGKQLWYVEYENKKRSFQFLPVPAAGIILVVELEKKKATLRALDLFGGQEKWQQSYKIQKGGHPTPPKVTPGSVISFYGHTRRLDPVTGKTLWERKDVVVNNLSPPPMLTGERLLVLDGKNKLQLLDPATGDSVMSAPLDDKLRYTNIYPTEKSLFLRGQEEGGAWSLAKYDPKTGKQLWNYRTDKATVSNIIEDGGKLYVATAAKVLCLDTKSGKELFKASATVTGQSFPVRLRKYGNSIVYIGELYMAGFDAGSGKKVWKTGMTPISQEAHLDALDNWMSVLQSRIKKLSKAIWFSGAGGASDAFSNMAANSQNLSNSYANQWRHYSSRARDPYNSSASSDGWKAANSANLSKMNSSFARAEAQLSFFFAMEGMKNAMLSKSIARDQAELDRLSKIRNLILASYTASESGDYAWRPHVKDGLVGIRLVHLPSGKVTYTPMSPHIKQKDKTYYNERMLWNVVDTETATVYHHSLRIVEDMYQKSSHEPGMTTYGIRLVAEKVNIQR
jgi:outer membrane protein assembly factor BamB